MILRLLEDLNEGDEADMETRVKARIIRAQFGTGLGRNDERKQIRGRKNTHVRVYIEVNFYD